jgi:hypothetical protein
MPDHIAGVVESDVDPAGDADPRADPRSPAQGYRRRAKLPL